MQIPTADSMRLAEGGPPLPSREAPLVAVYAKRPRDPDWPRKQANSNGLMGSRHAEDATRRTSDREKRRPYVEGNSRPDS